MSVLRVRVRVRTDVSQCVKNIFSNSHDFLHAKRYFLAARRRNSVMLHSQTQFKDPRKCLWETGDHTNYHNKPGSRAGPTDTPLEDPRSPVDLVVHRMYCLAGAHSEHELVQGCVHLGAMRNCCMWD